MDFKRELELRLEQKKADEGERLRRSTRQSAQRRDAELATKALRQEKQHRTFELSGDAPEDFYQDERLTTLKQFYDVMQADGFNGSKELHWENHRRTSFRPRKGILQVLTGVRSGTFSIRGYGIGIVSQHSRATRFMENDNDVVYLCEDYRIRTGSGESILGGRITPGLVESAVISGEGYKNGSDSPNTTWTKHGYQLVRACPLEEVLLEIATKNVS